MEDRDPRVVRRQQRQRLICAALARQALPTTALLPLVNAGLARLRQPGIGRRTLEQELRWMRRHLGDLLETVPAAEVEDAPAARAAGARAFHRLREGEQPYPIPAAAGCITGLEALALSAARAALVVPAPPGSDGPLADALGALLRRLALPDDRDTIAVLAGGPRTPYEATTLLACMRAIRGGSSISGSYRPRHRGEHPVRLQPVRLLLVDGEAFVWAWDADDRMNKRYHLARLRIAHVGARLAEAPATRRAEVAVALREAFRGEARGAQRAVRVRIAAERVAELGRLVFAAGQQGADLPDGSRTVSWRTRGLPALAEWIAGTGGGVRAEAPAELVEAVARIAAASAAAHAGG